MSPNTNQTQTATTGLTPQEAAARLVSSGRTSRLRHAAIPFSLISYMRFRIRWC